MVTSETWVSGQATNRSLLTSYSADDRMHSTVDTFVKGIDVLGKDVGFRPTNYYFICFIYLLPSVLNEVPT